MRSSNETYREVAERCSSYDVKDCPDCYSNSADEVSCLTCSHMGQQTSTYMFFRFFRLLFAHKNASLLMA